MSLQNSKRPDRKRYAANITLALVAAQVGCLTLVIVLLAVFGGLWLDNAFQTRPIITIVLVILSVPVSVLVMLAVVRKAVGHIQAQTGSQKPGHAAQEEKFGRDT